MNEVTDPPLEEVDAVPNDRGGLSIRIYSLSDDRPYDFGNYATLADLRKMCEGNGYQLREPKATTLKNDLKRIPTTRRANLDLPNSDSRRRFFFLSKVFV